ncbi:hypothetical protein CN692_03005 [Bacillus sp. AFS002410]|uniref:hypothetical protein n=1 Tax=Bacillus sp. AFS002410 TaxID=2033481 RepID=UPI000BF1FFE1|nr:hypothetical protein [Bacillus sp. AFS002410]PEJ60276.1 hypothetical protein CN692_03005 [Bacillus sp. AFS002410]
MKYNKDQIHLLVVIGFTILQFFLQLSENMFFALICIYTLVALIFIEKNSVQSIYKYIIFIMFLFLIHMLLS